MAVVFHLQRGVQATDHLEGGLTPIVSLGAHAEQALRLRTQRQVLVDQPGHALHVEQLFTGQPQAFGVLAGLELQRPSSSGPLAAQSRLEPVPYSLPAMISSGTPSALYCIAAA